MTKKEINEIKSQYTLEDCGILKLCACYVDGEKNKITKMNETFLNLPEEEKHKYFDIFKKTLSGTCGKILLTCSLARLHTKKTEREVSYLS